MYKSLDYKMCQRGWKALGYNILFYVGVVRLLFKCVSTNFHFPYVNLFIQESRIGDLCNTFICFEFKQPKGFISTL